MELAAHGPPASTLLAASTVVLASMELMVMECIAEVRDRVNGRGRGERGGER